MPNEIKVEFTEPAKRQLIQAFESEEISPEDRRLELNSFKKGEVVSHYDFCFLELDTPDECQDSHHILDIDRSFQVYIPKNQSEKFKELLIDYREVEDSNSAFVFLPQI
jgi:hypothetical protein